MSVVVVATMFPVPERRDEVLAAIEKAVAQVHAEDEGCELYAVHEGADGRIVYVEKWTSAEALAAHAAGAAIASYREAIAGLVQGSPDIQVLTPHPAGTDEQGVV